MLSSVVLFQMNCPLFGKLPKEVWGRKEAYRGFGWGNLSERDHLRNPGLDGRIILKWIFRKWDWGHGLELMWLKIRTGGGCL